jgi:hypothetical protein
MEQERYAERVEELHARFCGASGAKAEEVRRVLGDARSHAQSGALTELQMVSRLIGLNSY